MFSAVPALVQFTLGISHPQYGVRFRFSAGEEEDNEWERKSANEKEVRAGQRKSEWARCT